MDFVSKHFDFKPGDRCIVIGEVGVNHNCDANILFQLIDQGIAAGLDVIKLQRFNSALEISQHAALADYQADAGMTENQLKMAQDLELPDDLLVKAFEYCKEKGVGFLCTAFEHESVDFLTDKMGCPSIKVPSPEISNKPLLEYMARKFDALLVSTGASYLDEVGQALEWIKAVGGNKELALMHCTSQYPASLEQANLNAITTMEREFKLPAGYSDHTRGHTAAVINANLGGLFLEKHYTLDKNLPGPDHQASVDIAELTTLVNAVRETSKLRAENGNQPMELEKLAHLIPDMDAARASLGDGIKQPCAEEAETRPKIRKSLYVHADGLKAGTVITGDMIESYIIGIKRPYDENAISPEQFDTLIGKTLAVNKSHDEPLFMKDFG